VTINSLMNTLHHGGDYYFNPFAVLHQ